MVLDNEKQRELFLSIIQNVPLSGNFKEVEKVVDDVRNLRDAVMNAETKDSEKK